MPTSSALREFETTRRKAARHISSVFADNGCRVTKPTSKHASPTSRGHMSRTLLLENRLRQAQEQQVADFAVLPPAFEHRLSAQPTYVFQSPIRPTSWHPTNTAVDLISQPDSYSFTSQDVNGPIDLTPYMNLAPSADFSYNLDQSFSAPGVSYQGAQLFPSLYPTNMRMPPPFQISTYFMNSTSRALSPGLPNHTASSYGDPFSEAALSKTKEPELVGVGLYDDFRPDTTLTSSPFFAYGMTTPRKSLVLEEEWQLPVPDFSDDDDYSLRDFYPGDMEGSAPNDGPLFPATLTQHGELDLDTEVDVDFLDIGILPVANSVENTELERMQDAEGDFAGWETQAYGLSFQ